MDTGLYIGAYCVQNQYCDTHFTDKEYMGGKQIEVRCGLSKYDDCRGKNDYCGAGLECFGPLDCPDCDDDDGTKELCVNFCDYKDEIKPDQGPYDGKTFLNQGDTSICHRSRIIPDYIDPPSDEPALDIDHAWEDIDIEPLYYEEVASTNLNEYDLLIDDAHYGAYYLPFENSKVLLTT